MEDSKQRFSRRARYYQQYRPGYPVEMMRSIKEQLHINEEWRLADIGSGTGILTRLFLEMGPTVYAVEPNLQMRMAAESDLNQYERFYSIAGTAEKTHLKSHSIDLITSAQAFHWFDFIQCKKEFQRILKKNGLVLLIWNERPVQGKATFLSDYEILIKKYSIEYEQIKKLVRSDDQIKPFFKPNTFFKKEFSNPQCLDYQCLEGRFLSASYIPIEKNNQYFRMLNDLKDLFEKYQKDGRISFEYVTYLYGGVIS